MSLGKRCTVIFLAVLNLIYFVAGVVVDYKLISGERIRQILPHHLELSSVQLMLLDFFAVGIIILLISIVTTYLVCDVPYSPLEIIQNFALIFFIIPLLIGAVMVYAAFTTMLKADIPWIIVCAAVYLIFNAINISCALTVVDDK